MLPSLREHYAGKTLLLTGATGFLAKALLAKILRDLPEVERVLVLLRPRQRNGGQAVTAAERLEREVLRSTAFRADRARDPADFDRRARRLLRALEGDLSRSDLGLDPAAREQVAAADLIVNSAANVSFDERIDHALQVNAMGPCRLLELARELGCAFLHVSTAYSCGRRQDLVPETAPRPTHSAADEEQGLERGSLRLDELLAELSESSLRALAEGRPPEALVELGTRRARELGWNDTYTFTKGLGERLLVRERGDVALGILRPSIIESAVAEPEPGWIDGLRMGDPIIAAYGRGTLRKFPADPDCTIDFVPVDHVVNAALAAGAELGTSPPPAGEPPPVWHVATSGDNPLVFRRLFELCRAHFLEQPMRDRRGRPVAPAAWGFATEAQFRRRQAGRRLRLGLARAAARLLPGGRGRRLRKRLDRLGLRLEQLDYYARIYRPYCAFPARFETARTRSLFEDLASEDRESFAFDSAALDWERYVKSVHIPGLRRNVLREQAAAADDEPPAAERGLFDLLEAAASAHGKRPALRVRRDGRDREWTHAQLREAALRAAARLRALGVEDGDRVVLQAFNAPEWPIAYFGILAAGGVAVPLDQQTSPDRRAGIVRFTQARLVLLDRATAEESPGDGAAESRLLLEELTSEGASDGMKGLPRPRGGEDPASILFTSGTTLEPKGVVLPHRAFLANVDAVVRTLEPGPKDRLVSVLPLHHAFEFTAGLLSPLSQGASITYLETLSASALVATLRRTRATALLGVPRLFELLLAGIRSGVDEAPAPLRALLRRLWRASERAHAAGHDWGRLLVLPVHLKFGGRLRFMVSGGAALDPEVQRRFAALGFRLLEGYGLTETAPVLAVNPMDRQRPGSVGLPLPGVTLRIDQPAADGVGEIQVQGRNLMSGYYRDPEATRAVLSGGWFRTGDLGRVDEEGFVHVTGRLKDLIVTPSGKNVYPDEVEAALKDLPGVKESCVVGGPARGGAGEEVNLVVVLERDAPGAREAVRDAVAAATERLPSHQRVQRIVFRSEELPRTRLQKVQRSRVRAELTAPERHEAAGRPAEDGGDERLGELLDLLARLTGTARDTLREEQDLVLDLGVDSLMAAELVAAAGAVDAEGRPLPAAEDCRTVADLLALARSCGAPVEAASRPAALVNGHPGPAARLFAGTTAPLVKAAMPLLYGGWLELEVEGLEHLPGQGPYILAANHASHLDAGAVLCALGERARRVRVVAARDYFFDTPWKAGFFERLLNAIPFDRHGNWESGLENCREALVAGHSLLIFPEGTRSPTGRLQEFKAGVGRLASEAGVPIVPTRIDGTHASLPKGRTLPRRGRVRVRFGRPLDAASLGEGASGPGYERWRRLASAAREDVVALGRPAAGE